MSGGLEQMRQSAAVKKELIDAEREFIYQLLREGKITDEARRRIEYELDLEEARRCQSRQGQRRLDLSRVRTDARLSP